MIGQRLADAGRAVHQLAGAVGASIVQRLGARRAEGAFERADERAGRIRRQVRAAALAIGVHPQHQAAAFSTAAQMRSTTSLT